MASAYLISGGDRPSMVYPDGMVTEAMDDAFERVRAVGEDRKVRMAVYEAGRRVLNLRARAHDFILEENLYA